MSPPRVLIYLLRRDLRLSDSPVLHAISNANSQAPYTHLLPLYVFAPPQIEVSGFLASPDARSPYPVSRSAVGGFWRCGKRRAQFVAESVWGLHDELQRVGSGVCVRVGTVTDVLKGLLEGYEQDSGKGEVVGVWMTGEEAIEERREEDEVKEVVEGKGKEFRLWQDEKYLVDEYGCAVPSTISMLTVSTVAIFLSSISSNCRTSSLHTAIKSSPSVTLHAKLFPSRPTCPHCPILSHLSRRPSKHPPPSTPPSTPSSLLSTPSPTSQIHPAGPPARPPRTPSRAAPPPRTSACATCSPPAP